MLEGAAIPGMSTLDARMNIGVVFAVPLESAVRDVRFAETRTPPLSLIAPGKNCCKLGDGVDRKDDECFSPMERNVMIPSVSSLDDSSSVECNCLLLILCTSTKCSATELFQD